MTRPLQVGVQLPEVERVVRWPEVEEMALAAESVGFDSLWVGDHLLYRTDDGTSGPLEAWTQLAAVAAVTERIRLGPLVAATSFHAPQMLAKMAATVDEVSQGRLVLGLGAGWNEVEYLAYGLPFDHRAGRFEEAFTIVRTLLSEGQIDFHGDYYQARECVLHPAPTRTIPLMVGSTGPRVLRATLPHVDMWNTWHAWYGNQVAGLAPMLEDVRRIARDVGRDPFEIEMTAAVMVEAPGGSGRLHGSPGRATSAAITGSPQQLAETIAGYAAAGVGHVQLVVDPITTGSIEHLGRMLDLLDGF